MQQPNSLKIKVRISAGGGGVGGGEGGSRVLQGDGMSGYTRASAGAGGRGGLKVTKGMKIRAVHDPWTTELILLRVYFLRRQQNAWLRAGRRAARPLWRKHRAFTLPSHLIRRYPPPDKRSWFVVSGCITDVRYASATCMGSSTMVSVLPWLQ